MAAITTSTVTKMGPYLGRLVAMVETPNTADPGDTIAITLSDLGMSTFLGIDGYVHTTEDSIVASEAPTTSVTSGVLTITISGVSNTDKKRVYNILGK